MKAPAGNVSRVGTFVEMTLVPNPNWPALFKPQAYTVPLVVRKRECLSPAASCFTPERPEISRGRLVPESVWYPS